MKNTLLIILLSAVCFISVDGQNLKWAKNFGGTTADVVTSVVQDSSGNSFITGFYSGSITLGSSTHNSAGLNDIFIAKLDTAGSVIWSASAGGTNDDRGYSIAVDNSGKVYVCGQFSGNFTFGTTSISSAGGTDLFVARYNSSGTFQGIATAGGTNNERANSMIVNSNGDGYVVGYYNTTGGFGGGNASASFGSYTVSGFGSGDAFIAKVNSSGTWQWANGYGSARGADVFADLILSSDESYIYAVGQFRDTVNIGSFTIYSPNGQTDAFITRFNSSGTIQNVVTGGTPSNADAATGITRDANDNVYVCGSFALPTGGGGGGTGNTTFTMSGNTVSGSNTEGFIAALNNSLTLQWLKSYGSTNAEQVNKISYGNNELFVGGTFQTSTTIGSNSLTSAGGNDVFAAGLDTSGQVNWVKQFGGTAGEDIRDVSTSDNGIQFIVGSFGNAGTGTPTATIGSQTLTSKGAADGYVISFYTCKGLSSKVTYSGPTNFCNAGSVQMTASAGATSYQWYDANGAIAGAAFDTLTVSTAGSYYCIMTNSTGCQMTSANTTINIGTPPNASLSAIVTTICGGDSTLLTATSGSGYKYKWYYNNNAITGWVTNTFYYAKQAGDYKVEIDNYGCTAMSSSITLTVIAVPTITITAKGSTTFCGGDSVLLQADTNSTWFYQWERFATGQWNLINNANSDNYYAKNGGNHRVNVTLPNGCTVSSNVITINTSGANSVNLFGQPGSGKLCYGDSVRLTIIAGGGGGGGGLQYRWLKDGDTIAGVTTRSLTFFTDGTYSGVAILGNCKAASRDTVLHFINSVASITPTGNINFCSKDTVKFTATGENGSSYQWQFNMANIAGATQPNYDALNSGIYTCVISLGGCTWVSPQSVLTQFPAGNQPSVLVNGNNLASSITGTAYQWYFNSNPLPGANSQYLYGFSSGFYAVEVTDNNGCKNLSTAVSFTYINNGINFNDSRVIHVYPNPASGYLNLILPVDSKVSFKLIAIDGHEVISNSYTQPQGVQIIDISSIPEGTYIFKIMTEDRLVISKIQIIH